MKINFMTFNIQHCKNYITKQIDIDLMIKTIQDCQGEIVGLNEVYGEAESFPSQAKVIAEALGYYCYFGQAIIHQGRPYGNALLSKFPFETCETIMIPDPIQNDIDFFETRCIIKASFKNIDLTVFTSHFGLAQAEKENAVSIIIENINKVRTPIVFMGDLNMEPDDPLLKPIFSSLNSTLSTNFWSFPSINPNKRIDYIFASKSIKVLSSEIPNIVASDHFPHIASLFIK
ncbi:MAG: endonuclease/exonuclease/phosphatase family protein [Bacilli bacterium]